MRVISLGQALLGALAVFAASACMDRRGTPARQQDGSEPPEAAVLRPSVEPPQPARCTTQTVTSIGWPASPPGSVNLTVHVTMLGPRHAATVGWASLDGQRMSILNPVYGAPVPTYQGTVPAEPLQLYVDGLSDSEAHAAHAHVDLRKRKSAELSIALDEPRQLTTRQIVVRDRTGAPLAGVRGLPILDGSPTALHNAVANYQQWISDSQGAFTVRSVEGEPVRISLSVPLLAQPIVVTLMPGKREVRLEEVTVVRCTFRCLATGQFTPYPGYVALAELPDGTCNRFEIEESDGLSSEPIMLAWIEGTRKLSVSSSPYLTTTITSPDQLCELHPRPERQCAFWF